MLRIPLASYLRWKSMPEGTMTQLKRFITPARSAATRGPKETTPANARRKTTHRRTATARRNEAGRAVPRGNVYAPHYEPRYSPRYSPRYTPRGYGYYGSRSYSRPYVFR